MTDLTGTRTEENLKKAFTTEAETALRYLYYANRADIEGQMEIAALFRTAAAGEQGHALGHLDLLQKDFLTNLPVNNSRSNLQSAIVGETREYHDMYPHMAEVARAEGFDEIANWFEVLAKAERTHANRFQKSVDLLLD